uniref:Uncharacterized protein n=1 Tax=Caenorhabditis japonica TaxID=281687 RepID=A0A8R1DHJ9_CAEJA
MSNNHLSSELMSNSALFSLFGKLFNLVSDLKNQNDALLNKVQVLHTQNEFLADKVLNLETSVGELNGKFGSGLTSNKSFEEALKKGLSAAPTQLSLLKAAELAQSSEARKSAVVIKNVEMVSLSKLLLVNVRSLVRARVFVSKLWGTAPIAKNPVSTERRCSGTRPPRLPTRQPITDAFLVLAHNSKARL